MKTASLLAGLALAATATFAVAHPGGPGAGGFERLRAADANGDGLLSRTEVAALPRLAERFDAIDANKDGQISFEELKAARVAMRADRMAKMIARADTDGDGKVSRAEALAKATERFDRVDADKDGFLTAEELAAARRGHRHGR